MDCSPCVARSYSDVVRRLGIRTESWSVGRVVLIATAAPPDAEAIAAMSELAMAAAFTSICDREPGPPRSMRIGLFVLRRVWVGALKAIARARRASGRAWLIDCELRDRDEQLLCRAHACVPFGDT